MTNYKVEGTVVDCGNRRAWNGYVYSDSEDQAVQLLQSMFDSVEEVTIWENDIQLSYQMS